MKIWDAIKQKEVEIPNSMIEFLDDLETLFETHNLAISHEDCHGNFIIEEFKENSINPFLSSIKAYDNTKLLEFHFTPFEKNDKIYTLSDFKELEDDGWLMDDDGDGYYGIKDKGYDNRYPVFGYQDPPSNYDCIVWFNK
jgi:hypothetical protein